MPTILKNRFKGLSRYRLVVPVMIEDHAEGPIDHDEMKLFLSQNCLVSMGRLGTDVGPGESVVLPLVDWRMLRMMKCSSGESDPVI
jgi:hypothetical protein